MRKIDTYRRQSLASAAKLLDGVKPGQVIKVPGDGLFLFDMNWEFEQHKNTLQHRYAGTECDTAGCIFGLARLIEITAGRPETWPTDAYDVDSYRSLFYPGRLGVPYENVTPQQAAAATKRWLKGHKANPWEGVMPDKDKDE